MSKDFRMVPLSELLIKSEEQTEIDPEERYQQVTVRLWGKGVVLREEVAGINIAASKQFIVKANQFILSRIDARNGAFGLVPASLEGALVSSDFPVFTPNSSRIISEFLHWMSKTRNFVNLCSAASEGTTNRVRLKEDRFLATKIPLPPLEEQRRIVARIEELVAKIEKAWERQQEAVKATESLLSSALKSLFDSSSAKRWPYQRLIENNLATVVAGQHIMAGEYNSSGDGFPYITGPADFGPKVPKIKHWTLAPKSIAKPGDILLTVKGAGVGKINFAPNVEVAIGRQIMAIRPDRSYLSQEFVYFFLEHKFEHFQSIATATTVPGFKKKDVEELSIPVPPLSDQQRIVAYFDKLQAKIDTLKRTQAKTSEKLDAMLPSILDKAFKGEL